MAKKKRRPKSKRESGDSALKPQVVATLERWLQLAIDAQSRGDNGEAISFYKKILAKDRSQASVWHSLGGLLYQSGELDNALGALEAAREIEPENTDYLNDIGGLYLVGKQYQSAEAIFRDLLVHQPQFSQAQYNLATALYEQSKLGESVAVLRALIASEPGFAEAHFNLAISLRDLGHTSAAIDAFKKSIAIDQSNHRAQLEVARLYISIHVLDDAISAYRSYCEQNLDDAIAIVEFAEALYRNGDSAAALETLGDYQASHESNEIIEISRAGILHNIGDLGSAEAQYLKVLNTFPTAASNAAVGLSRLRRVSDDADPIIGRLHEALGSHRGDDLAAAPVHFALGKVYDDIGHYADAFHHYHQGNQIHGRLNTYDSTHNETEVEQILAVFSGAAINADRIACSQSERPVFVVGMPRSGTTLTEQILASHHDVTGAGELAFFPSLCAQLPAITSSDDSYPYCWRSLTEASSAMIIERYLDLLARHSTSTARVTDKLPGNYRHIGFIASLFPQAKFLVCQREPRDVALSIYFQYFSERHDYAWALQDIAHQYVQHERLVDHWSGVVDDRVQFVAYSDLIENHEVVARAMTDFLELEWDPACLNFHEHARDVRTASNWQVRQPIYRHSLERWVHYEQYLDEFTHELEVQRARYGIAEVGKTSRVH